MDTKGADVTGSVAVAAGRLGPMLRVARESKGLSLPALAANSGGRFDSNRLSAYERAEIDLSEEDREALAQLYEIDLSSLTQPRVIVDVDKESKVVRIGTAERPFEIDLTGPDAHVGPYLLLVRDLRSVETGYVALRHDDIDQLAEALEVAPATVLERLGRIMGASPKEIARMRRLFAVGAAILVAIGGAWLVGQAMTGSDAQPVTSESNPTQQAPDVSVSDEAVVIERGDVEQPASSQPNVIIGNEIPDDPNAVVIAPDAVQITPEDVE